MAYLYNPELLQPQDVNGVPLAGAKLFFYTTGTTTPITVYQDSGLLTPHASPVVADASGIFAPVYTAITGFKTVLKTSADVTVQTVDPVYAGTPNVVSYDSQTLTAAQQEQTRDNLGVQLRGAIWGLALSNNASDATNDIDIAAGEAASAETNPVLMVLASATTKRLDATWAVGTGNGGLDTGSIANATYHMFLIQRSDTGVVDVLFSASPTSPTMPTNYDRKRRIGSIFRSAGAIGAFYQNGDTFMLKTEVSSYSVAIATGSTATTMTCPTGLSLRLIGRATITMSVSGQGVISIADGVSGAIVRAAVGAALGISITPFYGDFQCDTNAQLAITTTVSSGTLSTAIVHSWGWIDRRGQDGGS